MQCWSDQMLIAATFDGYAQQVTQLNWTSSVQFSLVGLSYGMFSHQWIFLAVAFINWWFCRRFFVASLICAQIRNNNNLLLLSFRFNIIWYLFCAFLKLRAALHKNICLLLYLLVVWSYSSAVATVLFPYTNVTRSFSCSCNRRFWLLRGWLWNWSGPYGMFSHQWISIIEARSWVWNWSVCSWSQWRGSSITTEICNTFFKDSRRR